MSAFTPKIITACASPLPATIWGTSTLCNRERGRGTRASSIRVPCGSRSDIYSSPTSLHAKGASAASGFGVASPHGRRASPLQRQAGRQGAKGRQELAGSQGRAAGAVLPPYSSPDAGPVVPATSSSKSRAGARHPFFTSHGPGGADSIRLRCRWAGEGPRGAAGCHRSSSEKPPRAPRASSASSSASAPGHRAAATESCCPANGDGGKQTCAAATGHRPANYLDPSRFYFFFFFLVVNRGICNFLTTLIFLETEEIQLSTNCSSLVASKKNTTATELPRLTKLSQLTTAQTKPRHAGAATHHSEP